MDNEFCDRIDYPNQQEFRGIVGEILMLLKLSQERLELVKKLFIKWQSNHSALWCYLNGDINGETYVDNIESPTKAICVIFWGWGFVPFRIILHQLILHGN